MGKSFSKIHRSIASFQLVSGLNTTTWISNQSKQQVNKLYTIPGHL